jgi:hypothetical protein
MIRIVENNERKDKQGTAVSQNAVSTQPSHTECTEIKMRKGHKGGERWSSFLISLFFFMIWGISLLLEKPRMYKHEQYCNCYSKQIEMNE